jgi:hypothetical protein
METTNDQTPLKERRYSALSYEQKELLKVGKKLTRVGLQVRAVNQLHREEDGACAHCAVPYPCETKRLMREARESV